MLQIQCYTFGALLVMSLGEQMIDLVGWPAPAVDKLICAGFGMIFATIGCALEVRPWAVCCTLLNGTRCMV